MNHINKLDLAFLIQIGRERIGKARSELYTTTLRAAVILSLRNETRSLCSGMRARPTRRRRRRLPDTRTTIPYLYAIKGTFLHLCFASLLLPFPRV